MARRPRPPKTYQAALDKGYLPLSDDAVAQLQPQAQLAVGVDCTTAADGTLCFDSWQGGQHVVGYCQNGSCKIVST